MSMDFPISAKENLRRFMQGDPMWMQQYNTDIKLFSPTLIKDNVSRGFIREDVPYTGDFGGPDMFGIEWEFVPQVGGSMVRPGSPKVPDITEWEKYITWPDLSAMDWEGCVARNPEFFKTDRILMMMVFTTFFERLISMVDMENALIAMIDEDEKPAVHRLFEKLVTYYDELFDYLEKYIHPDLIFFHDDWGSQRAPLFSMDTVKEMLLPYLKQVVDSAHRHGMFFEFHSCGKIQDLVPAMIEMGADMWCGQEMNDKEFLYKEYGQDIKLGINVREFPKDVTDEELIAEADRILEKFPSNVYIGMNMIESPALRERIFERTLKRS